MNGSFSSDSESEQDEIITGDITIAPIVPQTKRLMIGSEVQHIPTFLQIPQPLVSEPPSIENISRKEKFNERITEYLNDIEENEWDRDAWNKLFSEIQLLPIDQTREIYEKAVHQFPFCGKFWKAYADKEYNDGQGDLAKVDYIFNQSLYQCYDINLWKSYLSYVQRTKYAGKKGIDATNASQEVENAYNIALDSVGLMIDSSPIWQEYIQFIKSLPEDPNDPQQYRSIIVAKLRKIYQKAIVSPTYNIDSFWSEYTNFEKNLNEQTEDKFRNKFSDRHKIAKDLLNSRRPIWDKISFLYLPSPLFDDPQDIEQLNYWKQTIELEISNPYNIPPLENRIYVHNTFLRCLTYMYYAPEIWYDFAVYESKFDIQNAKNILEKSLLAMPQSHYMHAAICDFYEERSMFIEAEQQYENGINILQDSFLWIMYMKYMQRNKGAEEMRTIFSRARKSNQISPQLFVTAAYLEFYSNKNLQYAINCFKLGMKYFSDDADYVLEFANFFINQGDDINARALLEKQLQIIPVNKCKLLWEKYLWLLDVCYMKGSSLLDISKLESRFSSSFPKVDALKGVLGQLHRYIPFSYKSTIFEDKSLYERKYPPPVVHIPAVDNGNKETKEDRSIVPKVEHIEVVDVPEWLRGYIERLPPPERVQARGSVVDTLIDTLMQSKLISFDEYQISSKRRRMY
ncbi:hypothetical protein WA158_003557 [Blastocystis sp. Blastoise]